MKLAATSAIAVVVGVLLVHAANAVAETSVSLEPTPDYRNPVLVIEGDARASDVSIVRTQDVKRAPFRYRTIYFVRATEGAEPSGACSAGTPTLVRCSMITQGSSTSAIVSGGGGGDRVRFKVKEGKMRRLTMAGGAGDDRLYSTYAAGLVLEGGSGDDRIEGVAGDNLMRGGTGDDLVISGSSGDVLDGGPGSDSLLGHGGSDLIYADDTDEDRLIDCGEETRRYADEDYAYIDPGDPRPGGCEKFVTVRDNG